MSVVAAGGGRAHRIGVVRGRHVDWQPLVSGRPRCDPPAGSKLVLRTSEVTITHRTDDESDDAYMACWRGRGVLRLLDTASRYDDLGVKRAFGFAAAGHYVAFEESFYNEDAGTTYSVLGFNLARGRFIDDLAGETVPLGWDDLSSSPTEIDTAFQIDSLLVGPGGAVAWLSHTTGFTATTTSTGSTTTTAGATTTIETTTVFKSNPSTRYEVDLHDSRGRRVLDSAVQSGASAPLAGLQLSGTTVTWLDDGQQRSAAADHG